MFTTIIVQPIFNLLVLIYALIPGHDFGLAVIVFTILVRLLLWPLLKKQLHHAKAIRALQPELKKIKAAAGGDRRKESMLTMELYKERQINPFASLGIVLAQIPILLGLYFALKRLIDDPSQIINFSYSFVGDLGWIQTLARDIHQFDASLFGVIDLTRTATGPEGIYFPALLLALGSAAAQFFQSRQLLPKSQDARSLRSILSQAGQGKSADQQEVSAAVGRFTLYLIPIFVLVFSLSFAAALPLYWFVSSSVAFLQQSRVLREDVNEAESLAKETTKSETAVAKTEHKTPSRKRSKSGRHSRKRRRR